MIVLANGVFDIFHVGHVRYLQEASYMGTALFVAVTDDKNVNKGDGRPLFNENERLEVVMAMQCVQWAKIFSNVIDALEQWEPAIFVKGREYEGKIERVHADYCKAHGIEIRFTDTETVRPRDRLKGAVLASQEDEDE